MHLWIFSHWGKNLRYSAYKDKSGRPTHSWRASVQDESIPLFSLDPCHTTIGGISGQRARPLNLCLGSENEEEKATSPHWCVKSL